MSSAELDDIVASMEAALRRAYALGRQDAIEQLTKFLQSDEVVSHRLALPAPADGPAPIDSTEPGPPVGDDQPPGEAAEEDGGESDQAVRPRNADRPLIPDRPARGGVMETIRDFVYPSRID